MNANNLRETSIRLFDAINNRDFETFEAIVTDGVRFDFPGVDLMEGRKRVVMFFKILFRKYSKLEFNVETVIADKSKTCVKWNNSGELSNGEAYSNVGLTWLDFEGEKIAFMSDYFKDTSFIK